MRLVLSLVAVPIVALVALVTFASPASAGPLDPFCVHVAHPWSGLDAWVCTPWS